MKKQIIFSVAIIVLFSMGGFVGFSFSTGYWQEKFGSLEQRIFTLGREPEYCAVIETGFIKRIECYGSRQISHKSDSWIVYNPFFCPPYATDCTQEPEKKAGLTSFFVMEGYSVTEQYGLSKDGTPIPKKIKCDIPECFGENPRCSLSDDEAFILCTPERK